MINLRLYPPEEIYFVSFGLGHLTDAFSCTVSQELNGELELVMEYPITGALYDSIAQRCIIMAKPDTVTDEQPFRIYRITKPMGGIITVYARHLVYDLSGIAVSPYTASGAAGAMAALKNHAVTDCPFVFQTDKSGGGDMVVSAPASIFSLMGGTQGSVLDTYGGEYAYNVFQVSLLARRGADHGVTIRYGKNLTDLEQDENCADCYTGVYPYYQAEDIYLELPERVVHAAGSFGYTKILPLDLTEKFEETPTEEQLRDAATTYITANSIGVPAVSWKVEFVDLEKTEDYKASGILERISLGDTVTVIFAQLGVNATARAVATEYNVLLDRYDSITLGRVKANLAQTIVEQQKEIDAKPGKQLVEQLVGALTDGILGARGGAVRLLDTNADGMPDTLYIADDPDPLLATKVWRFNYEGWGASQNGYDGPFTMGATLDDGLLASFVKAANLVAGTIQSEDGKTFYLDLTQGILRMEADNIVLRASGQSVEDALSGLQDDIQAAGEATDDKIQAAVDGIDSVTTSTGYTFNADGLKISKPGEEMANRLDNTGMYVTRNDTPILTANNRGVEAVNLTARQYLIVGSNSRFEDYTGDSGEARTGCFWIGTGGVS